MAIEALNHIEKTLADSYRKEIDQEENVWRSLPFFATTVALQIAALAQFITHLPPLGSVYSFVAIPCLILTGSLMSIALALLVLCINPASFEYIAREPELLRYAEALIRAQQTATAAGHTSPPIALDILQLELARQYAVGADNNRQINKRRELRRARAGIAIIGSMIATLFLVVTVFIYHYIPDNRAVGVPNGHPAAVTSYAPSRAEEATAKPNQVRTPVGETGGANAGSGPAHAAADANHH